ncbi:MAG: metallophosphoesterase [Acidobacteriota bacterium]
MSKAFILLALAVAFSATAESWKFAVAGDSRNCGDVVMPGIAAGVKADKAAFYWHLGDFRALSDFDQDMVKVAKRPYTIGSYFAAAWPDFIRNQVAPFSPVPVYLGIGNHELVPPKTRGDYIAQFADWLLQPPIPQQRIDPDDHLVRTYFRWKRGGVDFISLDNASYEFDATQLAWITKVLARDADDPEVKAIVLGMHAALPHSLGCDHSMDETAAGEYSGSVVYRQLLDFRAKTKKNVYVIASHSHFLFRDVYDSPYWRAHGGVIPGIIIGTAGAVRYRLPDTAQGMPPERVKTDVYGYLLATVDDNGTITFEFKQLDRAALPADVLTRYGGEFVDWCFVQNTNPDARSSEPCSKADAPCGPMQR